MEQNFQAVMRLEDRRSTNGSSLICRYACIGAGLTELLLNTLEAGAKTRLGNIWVFDPNSTDPQIRERSLADCAWFKRETGADLTQYLPAGTPIVLTSTDTPVHYFLTGYKADMSIDESGRTYLSQHPDLVSRDTEMQAIFREQRKTMRLAGLDREKADIAIANSFMSVLTDEIKAMRSVKTPKVNLSELDFSKIDFGAVPVTPPADKQEDLNLPDFSTPADDTKAKA